PNLSWSSRQGEPVLYRQAAASTTLRGSTGGLPVDFASGNNGPITAQVSSDISLRATRTDSPTTDAPPFSNTPYLHGEHTMLGESMQWIRTPGWKYVWLSGSGHEQLFDMAGDRAERIDRARDPECAHVLQECRRALIDELTGRQEGYVRDGVLVPGREPLNVLDGAGAQPRGVPQQPSRHIGAA